VRARVRGAPRIDLGRELYLDGYHNIVNIDFSLPCIIAQRLRNADCPGMVFLEMDMLLLQSSGLDLASFDVVLDKCTLDALVVDEGDVWNPRAEVRAQVDEVLSGVSALLKPEGGQYLQLSFGQPIHRLNHYFEREKYGWLCTVSNWGEALGFGYFFYEMVRTSDKEMLKEVYEEKRRVKQVEEDRIQQYAEQQRRAHEGEVSDDEQGAFGGMDL
jgi:hypothetical protein